MRTLSLIKADVGSTAGHLRPTETVVAAVEDTIDDHTALLDDWIVFTVGDDIDILMSHERGEDDDDIHQLAWDAFQAGTAVATEEGLYGAGQDLLEDAFSGNVKGLGPGVAELSFVEREAEPLMIFGADKTEPGAFNQPLYTSFADPRYTSGLVLKSSIHEGFTFRVMDLEHTDSGERIIDLTVPQDGWRLAALLMEPHRFGIRSIHSVAGDEPVVSVSTQKLRHVAGEYVGKDDPVAIVRTQSDFPSPGEILQPYGHPPFVSGAMRGSHNTIFYPIRSDEDDVPAYFDGPALVKAIGLTLNDGVFSDPVYPFDASFWDAIREEAALDFRDFRERQGLFGPGTVGSDELEYGGWQEIITDIDDDWEMLERAGRAPAQAMSDD